jgi:gliding motility-associated lipoprotein GldH
MNAVYDAQVEIAEAKWYKDEVARFEVAITDTTSQCDFVLSVRNNMDYSFSNLYVFLNTRFPNGNMTRDTIECILADRTGKWLGKGWGNIKDNRIVLKSGLTFPISGTYEFYVQQAMRKDTLEGIVSVGLRIEKTQ